MKNQDLRDYAKKSRVFLYEIATSLNVTDSWLSKTLRKELPQEKKDEIFKIIDSIKRGDE